MRAHDVDKLQALVELTSAMLHGRPAFEQRLDEMTGGFPSQGDGSHGSGSSSGGGPTLAAVSYGSLGPLPDGSTVHHPDE